MFHISGVGGKLEKATLYDPSTLADKIQCQLHGNFAKFRDFFCNSNQGSTTVICMAPAFDTQSSTVRRDLHI